MAGVNKESFMRALLRHAQAFGGEEGSFLCLPGIYASSPGTLSTRLTLCASGEAGMKTFP